ncbi:MAG: hypothetical protein Q9215_001216 [Flavoplaca cf. flavocitrina]
MVDDPLEEFVEAEERGLFEIVEEALLEFDVAVTGSTVFVPVPPVPVGPAVVEF